MKDSNKEPKVLKENDLEKISGGEEDERGTFQWVRYHNDCGGVVTGVNVPWAICRCQRCGAHSYFANMLPGGYVTVREYDNE